MGRNIKNKVRKAKESLKKGKEKFKKGKDKAKIIIKSESRKVKEAFHRCKCPNNNLFIISLISIIFFLLVELVSRIYDLYRDVPMIDVPSHFFGGIALGLSIYWIFSLTLVKRKTTTTVFYTFIGASFWELMETLQDFLIYNPPYLQDFFFWDGFWDIIVTTLGGLSALIIIRIIKNNTILLDKIH